MAIEKKKISAILSAIEIYLQEEKRKEIELYKPCIIKAETKESPWVRYGRYLAMSVRNQCQSRLFK
ncbi:MAG: hypothetical protein N2999_04220 [Proteobacteria bacterium]|nr:hypothetical protein [Pseudomonadota bacterium]